MNDKDKTAARAKWGMTATAAIGIPLICSSLWTWAPENTIRFIAYLWMVVLAAVLKIKLPSVPGASSMTCVFLLGAILKMSFQETVLLGCAGVLVEQVWRPGAPQKPLQVLFCVSNMAVATAVSYQFHHWPILQFWNHGSPLLLLASSLVLFFLSTVPTAGLTAWAEPAGSREPWRAHFAWPLLFYPVGAAMAWVMNEAEGFVPWYSLGLFIALALFFSLMYVRRSESQVKYTEEMQGIHFRAIKALALVIETNDHTTHDHLRRVQTYAVEIARELGLPGPELEALRAAALLHDIGKLAVPAHIISKPGRLTAEEFEKIKIHPLVGAEILERVEFPYPVAPIVRAHHEKWDGSGYPFGLQGEQIPIGARIVAAVDSLDALASDRLYRRALPLDKAMEQVAALAGKAFDPKVVEVLKRRYVELERLANPLPRPHASASPHFRAEGEAARAAGSAVLPGEGNRIDFLKSIASARQEVQLLFDLLQDLGTSLSVEDTLSMIAVRLKRMIPYTSMVVYVCRDQLLVPEYVSGGHAGVLSSLRIPMGQGLSGWVAENKKPIVNGDPSAECEDLADGSGDRLLRSALSVPLGGLTDTFGVLTLYSAEENGFSADHLRILLATSAKMSLSIENAMRFRDIQNSATMDYLTGLPNARSLFMRLQDELDRCGRRILPLALLVCDVDGLKQVNDRHGPLEGNKLLRLVADVLRAQCREGDYVARMGGDEFVVLLADTEPDTGYWRITQLEQAVHRAGRKAGIDGCSLSVGDAYYPDDGTDAEQLLAKADQRMYRAKQLNKAASIAVSPDTAHRPFLVAS